MKYDRYIYLKHLSTIIKLKQYLEHGLAILLELKQAPDFDHTIFLGKIFHVG